jgi:hypothetical protein
LSRCRISVLAALLAGAALATSGCGSERSAAGSAFEPVTPGVLTYVT